MPVKNRRALARRQPFTPEVLRMFVKLESMVPQRGPAFEEGSRQLARMLGLTAQWWTRNHVNDRSEGPCHAPGYAAYEDWHTCRQAREALLVAVKSEERHGERT